MKKRTAAKLWFFRHSHRRVQAARQANRIHQEILRAAARGQQV